MTKWFSENLELSEISSKISFKGNIEDSLTKYNIKEAIEKGGIVVRRGGREEMSKELSLLSPGRGDTRHFTLTIGAMTIPVKQNRTHLAVPVAYFDGMKRLPKVCAVTLKIPDWKYTNCEILLFYRGIQSKRKSNAGI